ncbi:hypothetical protein CC85DRAFT_287020 [Cutaneotrichosporon oleaginosum]|uniref:Uncharacterized protein n=1 Tax=Cutaneotrichosporon oleaginosum TaxID=879819 RepID=A0A0J0XIC2_9TREE|nr:uncharacterized protein CC85DRAFT_287020 [Cutaneotrichosporon oleaginosum]KLT40875.1 hypothetical protein CC85DRAFT_287020 [Cutaneotrichosporon oleaginosum]TXT09266.1 hypothetical protein COLE_03200 [Cutaneotrichosporon oleaginosum]
MFKKLKEKVNSKNDAPSGGLQGMSFRGGPPSKPGAASGAARPSWSTSLDPDRPGATAASLSPPRAGVAFIDARVALVSPKELGYLLAAMAKLRLRPVLVPSLAKIVGQVCKEKGGTGVQKERTIIENLFTNALSAAKAGEDVVAALNPALDVHWVGDKKYALDDVVHENVWLALVEGVEDNGENRPAMAASGVKQSSEALKQSADRLTISSEIVTVSRHTLGPHIFFAGDEILEAAAVKDAGGPYLTGTTFKNIDKAGLGFKSQADADAFVKRVLEQAKIDAAASPPIAISNGAPTNGNGNAPGNSNGTPASASGPGTSPTQSLWLRNADTSEVVYDVDPKAKSP